MIGQGHRFVHTLAGAEMVAQTEFVAQAPEHDEQGDVGGRLQAVYVGTTMNDPALVARLAAVTAPVLVLWGEADRMADVAYGRAYAAALPTARFQLLTRTGHLPQVETPRQVLDAISTFAGADVSSSVRS